MTKFGCWIFWVLPESHCHLTNLFVDRQSIRFFFSFLYERCRVLTATKANKTERFIRSSALLDTKSTHSLNARSHCSVPVCPARTTAVRYALLLIQPLYTTFSLFLRTYTYINEDNANIILSFNLRNLRIQKCNQPSPCQMAI